jgi:hypothetical protein
MFCFFTLALPVVGVQCPIWLFFAVPIIIIIIGKDTISFMQGSYTYIPETNHVPKEYNVAAIL